MKKNFITYEEALSVLKANTLFMKSVKIPLKKSGGMILDEHLIADRDFPPFNRVTMDGIAINYKSYASGNKNYRVSGISPAGSPQKTLKNNNECLEVMTGSILPVNSDTVIPYEDIILKNDKASLKKININKNQNVHFKGMDRQSQSIIVKSGTQISSAEINIAASIGKSKVFVKKMLKAIILSSGDELVDIDELPQPHQIRKSNVYGIQNTLKAWGVKSKLAHLPDNKLEIKNIISKLLNKFDFLIMTGGVSKGKYDYLPEVLESINVEKHFHKIQQRPGKPFWFGTSKNNKKIFALPGNPVSSFVCLYAYIRYWLLESLNLKDSKFYVTLEKEVLFKPNLIYFLEAKISNNPDGKTYAMPMHGNGSGDFSNLVEADGFLILPQEKEVFLKGNIYPFIPYRSNI